MSAYALSLSLCVCVCVCVCFFEKLKISAGMDPGIIRHSQLLDSHFSREPIASCTHVKKSQDVLASLGLNTSGFCVEYRETRRMHSSCMDIHLEKNMLRCCLIFI